MALYTQAQGSPFFIFEAPGDGGTIVLTNGAPVSGVINGSGIWEGSGIVGDPDGPTTGNDLIILNGNAQGNAQGPIEVNGLAGNDTVRLNGLFTGGFGRGGADNDFLTWINIVSSSIRGGGGNDIVEAGNAAGTNASKVNGNEGNDLVIMRGNVGNSLVAGGGGDDIVTMLTGSDTVTTTTVNGGGGNDLITDGGVAITGAGNWLGSTINGDDGSDTVNFANATVGLTITGGNGNDSLIGGAADDAVDGSADNDIIDGLAGNDELTGGTGNDRFRFANFRQFTDTVTDFETTVDRLVVDVASTNGATNYVAPALLRANVPGAISITAASGYAQNSVLGTTGVGSTSWFFNAMSSIGANGVLLFTRWNAANAGNFELVNPDLASGGAVNYGRQQIIANGTVVANGNFGLWSGANRAAISANIQRALGNQSITLDYSGNIATGTMFNLAFSQFFGGNTIGFALGRGSASGDLNLFAITARSITNFTINPAVGPNITFTMVGFNFATTITVPTLAGTPGTIGWQVDADINNFGVRFVNVIAESQLPFAGGDIFLF